MEDTKQPAGALGSNAGLGPAAPKRCEPCRATGAVHCSDPEHCGGPWDRLVEAEAKLLPCPFCGAGQSSIRENGKVWSGMRYSAPASVSVLHHCKTVEGQPNRAIERVGRDLESAIAAWNLRA